MAVYDDQKHRRAQPARKQGASTLPSNSDLNEMTSIDPAEEAAIQNRAAQAIRQEENAAAAGKTGIGYDGEEDQDTGSSTGSGYDDAAYDGTRVNLKNQEAYAGGFYRPEGEGGQKRSLGDLKGNLKMVFKKQRNLWMIGIVSSMIGGSWMFILLAVMSGPLQFIHMGRSVEQFHMSIQEAQTGAIALKLSRNIYHVSNGNRFKTSMGFVGNRYADRIDASMKQKGITPDYTGGFFRGYVVDPAKINSSDYPGMRGNSPEAVLDYYKDHYGVKTATIQGGKIRLPATGNYFGDTRMIYATMRSAKFGVLTPVTAHIAKKRIGFTLNPMSYWIRNKDNQILDTAEKKLTEWRKQQREYVKQGTKVPTANFASGKDQDGKDTNPGGADDASNINDQVQETSEAVKNGDTSKINEFRNSIHARLTGTVAAAIGVLCFAKAIATQYDIFTQDSIIQPMERVSAQVVSWGSANERGTPDVVDTEANGYMGERLCNDEGCWSDARPIQAYFNRAETGPMMPEEAEVNPEGNFLTRFLEAIPGLDAACSTAGQIGLTIVGVIIGGPISTFISVVVGVLSGPLLEKFIDWIIKTFLAEQIDPLAEGPLLGNYAERGGLYLANDVGLGSGGDVLSEEESQNLREEGKSYQIAEFEHKSLAYRLFDSNDPRSFAAQVIDRQRPDPAENLSHVAVSILGIGRNFGTTLLRPLAAQVSAQGQTDYTNGWHVIGFKPSLLNSTSPTVENLWVNADLAADILDANAGADGMDNYVKRAKVCFGRDIVKREVSDVTGAKYDQYDVAEPVRGEVPTYKTVADDKNKCDEGDDDPTTVSPWQRVRLFIKSTDVIKSMACRIADQDDEVGQQACTAIGNEDNSGAGDNQ